MLCLIAAVLLNPDPYELHRFDGNIYYEPRNRSVSEQVNNLLNSGEAGLRELSSLVNTGSEEARRIVATEALFLDRPEALPAILQLADEERKELLYVAIDAVRRYPRECWPILVKMATEGNVGALKLASDYKHKSRALAEQLKDSPHEAIRAATIHVRSDAEVLNMLRSNSEVIREAAVGTVLFARTKYKNRAYHHPDGRVRALALKHTQRWVERELKDWVPFAYDEHSEARVWALYQLAPLSMDWYSNQPKSAAIRAVRDAIQSGEKSVREAGVQVTRSWLMNWKHALATWRPPEITMAKKIYASRTYRVELKRQAGAETTSSNTVFLHEIQMAPAAHCLLIIDGKEVPKPRLQ